MTVNYCNICKIRIVENAYGVVGVDGIMCSARCVDEAIRRMKAAATIVHSRTLH